MGKKVDVVLVISFQGVLLVLFFIFTQYKSDYNMNAYPNQVHYSGQVAKAKRKLNLGLLTPLSATAAAAASNSLIRSGEMHQIRTYFANEDQLNRGLSTSTMIHHHPNVEKIQRVKLAILVIFVECVLSVSFVLFAEYSPHADASNYANSIGPTFGGFAQRKLSTDYHLFQDVHVMIFVGFGYLMTFLRRYGYSAVGFNFLLGALIIQWAILCQGFWELNSNRHVEVSIGSLLRADIAAAAVLISMGAVLGRTTYVQLLVMGIIETAVYAANSYLGIVIFQVSDAGGSIFVHTFGAYFGLAVSYIIGRQRSKVVEDNPLEESRYTSDLFAMIGTIFLWLYWPSFNAIELTGDDQHRAVINTYLSLASCCVTTFAISLILTEDHKFDMVHVQNSTLAGGVAVGTSANLMLEPWGAVIVGMVAGALSVTGYAKLTPWLRSSLRIRDTCGVHNLHGMPGILAGLVGALMAAAASEEMYFKSLYEIYPARASPNHTATAEFSFLKPGAGRSASEQAGYQLLALGVTVIVSITSGLVTGFVLIWELSSPLKDIYHFDDEESWMLPRKDGADKIFDARNGSVLLFKPFVKNNLNSLNRVGIILNASRMGIILPEQWYDDATSWTLPQHRTSASKKLSTSQLERLASATRTNYSSFDPLVIGNLDTV